MDSSVEREVKIWEKRIFYPNEKFRPDTKADLKALRECLDRSREFFTVISSETEACVYKIGRFMVEYGLKNSSITFQDGEELENYVDANARYDYQAKQLLGSYFENQGSTLKGKWLFIPYISCPWNKQLAYYFIDKLKQSGANGLLFYSNKNKPDGLAQVLCEETYVDVFQFPAKVYKHKRETHVLEDDGY